MSDRRFINGYAILRDFSVVGGGQCRWTFAERGGREYFIKEFLSPKFPDDAGPGSAAMKDRKRQRCLKFEQHHKRIMTALKEAVGIGGNLVATLDFFRYGTMYYKVTEKVDDHRLTPEEISALNIQQRILILKTVAHSLDILHQRRLVHGDLKPANILIKKKSKRDYVAKLIDFDNSYIAGEPPEQPDEIVGDLVYYSPELSLYLQGDSTVRPEDLQTASDVFALGLIFCQYLTGQLPEFEVDKYQYACNAVYKGAKLGIPDKTLPKLVVLLIESMLQAVPEKRPKIHQIFKSLKKWDKETPTAPAAGPKRQKLGGTLIHPKSTLVPRAPATPRLRGALAQLQKKNENELEV